MAKWDIGTGTHAETERSACSGSRGMGPCVVVCAVCFQEEVAQDRVSKQSSYFSQAVGNLAEETEAMMEDTLETVFMEKKKRKGSVP